MTDLTEPTEVIETKVKKEISDLKRETLAKARAKALEVRKANKELRDKEKAIEKAEKEKKLRRADEKKAKLIAK